MFIPAVWFLFNEIAPIRRANISVWKTVAYSPKGKDSSRSASDENIPAPDEFPIFEPSVYTFMPSRFSRILFQLSLSGMSVVKFKEPVCLAFWRSPRIRISGEHSLDFSRRSECEAGLPGIVHSPISLSRRDVSSADSSI